MKILDFLITRQTPGKRWLHLRKDKIKHQNIKQYKIELACSSIEEKRMPFLHRIYDRKTNV